MPLSGHAVVPQWGGLKDPDKRYRQRAVDFVTNPAARSAMQVPERPAPPCTPAL